VFANLIVRAVRERRRAADDDRQSICALALSVPSKDVGSTTQRVALAIVVGRGRNRLISVKLMKELDLAAQAAYDAGFKGQFLPIAEGQLVDSDAGRPSRGDRQPVDMNAGRPQWPGTPGACGYGVTVACSPSRGLRSADGISLG